MLVVLRGSRRACRYVGLALAIPLVIGFFGYYEEGYVAMSVAAFPVLLHSLQSRRHDRALEVGAGVHALPGLLLFILRRLKSAAPWVIQTHTALFFDNTDSTILAIVRECI